MSSIATRIRACGIAFALVVLGSAPGVASAEDYLRATYDDASIKPDGGGVTSHLKGLHFDLRQDAQYLPLFVTFGFDGYRFREPLPVADLTEKFWGGNFGFGYAYHPSSTSEISARLQYAHVSFDKARGTASACCFTKDSGTFGLGGYSWFNSAIKGYTEISYTKVSHDEKSYGGKLGLEFAVTNSFRLFADYGYSKIDESGFKSKAGTVAAGIKLPFGGKAGPTAVAVVEETPAPPAPKPVAGQTLKLKAGAQLHAAPKADAGTVNAGDSITLQSSVTNAAGTWWYVSSGKDFGWALESDIETTPAPAPTPAK